MLKSLHIENYAIIDALDLELASGLNTLTGQTGAGKSILLGALGLLSGARAEAGVIGANGERLVVEGVFRIEGYGLQQWFEGAELDYAQEITVRRVVSAGGKSRAFVDDQPVGVGQLKELMERLVDIHSQHETLLVARSDFQREALDAVASAGTLLQQYHSQYNDYRAAGKEVERLEAFAASGRERSEFLAYQLEKLTALSLDRGETAELEAEQQVLANAEQLGGDLGAVYGALEGEDENIVGGVRSAASLLVRAARTMGVLEPLAERLESAAIELADIASEVESLGESVVADPKRLEWVEERLGVIFSECRKNGLSDGDELVDFHAKLIEEYEAIEGGDEAVAAAIKKRDNAQQTALSTAEELHRLRKKTAPVVEQHVIQLLEQLGIRGGQFQVEISTTDELAATGRDRVRFLFAGGAGQTLQPLERVASGGEMSRLMLALKSLVAHSLRLPTVVFDEIDTGVSGAVADAMGVIIEAMGVAMQVINITHLPQVASKGEHHYIVYKEQGKSNIRKLTSAERLEQIASMLSGSVVTDAARAQARELLCHK